MRGARPRTRGSAERGNALVIGLLIVFVMAGLAAGLLQAGLRGTAESASAADRARVLYIAEAGMKDALLDLRSGGSGSLGSKAAPVAFGGGGYWATCVDHGDQTFTITANGRLSAHRRALQAIIAPDDQVIFTKALFGDLDLDASGSVTTDSYDASLGSYASQAVNVHGPTGLTYANANGTLGSNGNVSIGGSVKVLGDVVPGPGGTVSISGGGVYIDGATAPAASAEAMPPLDYSPGIPTAGDLDTNSDMTFTAGTYRYSSVKLKSHAELTFDGDVILYVDGDFDMTGQAKLTVSAGGSLTIYHAGADFHLGGGGMVNESQTPDRFRLFSTGDTVTLRGNANFYGAVYAPNAVIDARGTTDLFGSFVGRRISVGGNAAFHFDESLAESPETRSTLRVVSWRRIAPEGD